MYGKLFESCFEGSMVGLGSDVFALWSYILAKAKFGMVDLNPRLVSAAIGMSVQEFHDALGVLSAPDEQSRNPEEDGRRVVQRGPLQWEVVSWKVYEAFKSTEGHRAYMREARRASRDRKSDQSGTQVRGKTKDKVITKPPASSRSRPTKWTRVPSEWKPNDGHPIVAQEAGLSPDAYARELAKFRDHEFKSAKTDADAAFRTWLRNEGGYQSGPRRQAPVDPAERQARRAVELRRAAEARERTVTVTGEVSP
jgi:hypothetical protein